MKRGRPRKNGDPERPFGTLSDIGMTKRQSPDWQKLAEIPEAEFMAILKRQQDAGRRTSTAAIIREWHGARARRLASLERMAAELRAAGWTVFPPPEPDGD
jgi:hypothetical protein